MQFSERILAYIRREKMISAGDRVGVAVSGGADSVALLRALLELGSELGAVLSVVHFNHKIRGAAADADEEFVRALADKFRLQFHSSSHDVPGHAKATAKSLETAARELRYGYFDRLLAGEVSTIATAHTVDDQAETVLMRLVRGAGTRGLAGIYPVLPRTAGKVVRPLLCATRAEVLANLQALNQDWRDDSSNLDLEHTRNRVRHKLLPRLVEEFNPAITRVLGELAELARAEEEFWTQETQARAAEVLTATGLNAAVLIHQPVALQRRLLRLVAERAGLKLDFEHIETLRRIASNPSSTLETCELPGANAIFNGRGEGRELRFEPRSPTSKKLTGRPQYEYKLRIPGEVRVPETRTVIRASVVESAGPAAEEQLLSVAVPAANSRGNQKNAGYNRPELLDPRALAPELTVRNWRPGDRYWPAHRKASKKVKELLQNTTLSQRESWPVVASAGQIVWMRGFPPAADFLLKESSGSRGVLIQEVESERR